MQVRRCQRCCQTGPGRRIQRGNRLSGEFQIISQDVPRFTELLYIYYASVCVQCVREGSKKVQKVWLIGKRWIVWVGWGSAGRVVTWLYSKGSPLVTVYSEPPSTAPPTTWHSSTSTEEDKQEWVQMLHRPYYYFSFFNTQSVKQAPLKWLYWYATCGLI